jgi:hypothetical protein
MADAELTRVFKADVLGLDPEEVVRRHITYGSVFALTDELHFALKTEVSRQFGVHPSEVVVVGSAKLGFSLKPRELFRSFWEQSDIDIAIVSPALFDELWEEVFDYEGRGGSWSEQIPFKEYLFKGWIRPDKLPQGVSFPRGRAMWDYFIDVTRSRRYGPYRLRGAVFRSWRFLEAYQALAVTSCRYEV